MSVSNTSVIHYTTKRSTLFSIMSDKAFKPSFCCEKIKIEDEHIQQFAVAQVSFCDIPFSQISAHVKSYGKYAIGLSKNWAKENRLNPVLYIGQDTPINYSLKFMIEYLLDKKNAIDIGPKSYIFESLKQFLSFTKHHTDDLYRKNKTYPKYSFYNEREWRYVPTNIEKYLHFIHPDWDKVEIKEQKISWNQSLEKEMVNLKFEYKDITYIIFKEEQDIPSFISYCKKRLSPEDYLELLAKVTTIDRIQCDI